MYEQETMVTKGVASVRSPVRNIRSFGAKTVDHDDFVRAVTASFEDEFAVRGEVDPGFFS